MASRMFGPSMIGSLRTPLFAVAVGASACFAVPALLSYRMRPRYLLDTTSPSYGTQDWSFNRAQGSSQAPLSTKQGVPNKRTVRQLTTGSIFGLLAGLGVSVFSKSLTLLIGLLIIGVQTAESYGVRLVPYKRLQRYFTNVDLQSVVQENVPFKLSFGTIFALSAFAHF